MKVYYYISGRETTMKELDMDSRITLNNTPFPSTYDATDKILTQTWLNSGGTFNSSGDDIGHIEGYAVNGGYVDTLMVRIDDPHIREKVARFIQRVPTIGNNKPYVGTWIEGDILYVDLVKVFTNKYAAITQGFMLGEKAIYDLSAGKTIYL